MRKNTHTQSHVRGMMTRLVFPRPSRRHVIETGNTAPPTAIFALVSSDPVAAVTAVAASSKFWSACQKCIYIGIFPFSSICKCTIWYDIPESTINRERTAPGAAVTAVFLSINIYFSFNKIDQ